MTIGKKIRQMREEYQWSQRELAKRAKVRQSLISELENEMKKETRTDIARKLAAALRVQVGWLITPDEENIEDAA